jgi:phage baseplate assembly protein W
MLASRGFKDLSITFDKNPVTEDLLVTKNEEAIKRSISNLILTKPGERFFNLNIGCRVSDLLFESLDFITAGMIRSEIEYTINAFEPRVSLKGVDVEIDEYNNAFGVIISYIIIGQPEQVKTLEVILERTRA